MSGSLLEEPPLGEERGASPLLQAVEHLRPHELFMRFPWGPGRCFGCTTDERPVTLVIEIVWAGITALESLCPPCLFRAPLRRCGSGHDAEFPSPPGLTTSAPNAANAPASAARRASDGAGGPIGRWWVDTDNGDVILKGLTADPDDPRVIPFLGTDHVEIPGRMKPIILEALDYAPSLGFDPED